MPVSDSTKDKIEEIAKKHADLPTSKQDKTFGTEIGD